MAGCTGMGAAAISSPSLRCISVSGPCHPWRVTVLFQPAGEPLQACPATGTHGKLASWLTQPRMIMIMMQDSSWPVKQDYRPSGRCRRIHSARSQLDLAVIRPSSAEAGPLQPPRARGSGCELTVGSPLGVSCTLNISWVSIMNEINR